MNEIGIVLGISPLFPNGGCECHSWLPIHLGEAVLDFCAICGLTGKQHPADAFDEDEEDVG